MVNALSNICCLTTKLSVMCSETSSSAVRFDSQILDTRHLLQSNEFPNMCRCLINTNSAHKTLRCSICVSEFGLRLQHCRPSSREGFTSLPQSTQPLFSFPPTPPPTPSAVGGADSVRSVTSAGHGGWTAVTPAGRADGPPSRAVINGSVWLAEELRRPRELSVGRQVDGGCMVGGSETMREKLPVWLGRGFCCRMGWAGSNLLILCGGIN